MAIREPVASNALAWALCPPLASRWGPSERQRPQKRSVSIRSHKAKPAGRIYASLVKHRVTWPEPSELARRDDMTEGSLARQRRDGWFSEQEQLGAPVGQHAALRL
jgi:hypothetical protein